MSASENVNGLTVEVLIHSIRLTVPLGVLPLVDGGTPQMGGVSSGVAQFTVAPTPKVGIHTLTAAYSGDADNQASNSGQQTAVITGSTSIEVTANSGGINSTATLPITLN